MPKKLTLFYNPKAGFFSNSVNKLLEALQNKGFETNYVNIKAEDYAQHLQNPGDLIVVAGGDGTLKKVCRHLVNHHIPIGLLPLGSANNVAKSMGISGRPEDIIANWDLSTTKPFGFGRIVTPSAESRFIESIGFGLLAHFMKKQESQESNEKGSKEDIMKEGYRRLLAQLEEAKAYPGSLLLEDKPISGSYLLVEIMNISNTGPNIPLAPLSLSRDGLLHIVAIKEEKRDLFRNFISELIHDRTKPGPLPTHTAKAARIEWKGPYWHVDDDIYENKSTLRLEVELSREPFVFLASKPGI